MRPLPEQYDIADANEPIATALLKHVEPLEPSAARKRRVWMALERSATRRSRVRLSGPVVAGLVLCAATAASATMPHVWKRFQKGPVEVTAIAESEPQAAHHRSPPAAPKVPVAAWEPALPESTLPHADPLPAARKPAPARSRVAAAEPADPPASAALMVEAMRERRAGNLSRARELSAEYRSRYPHGALQEEALALSIEAAAALGDDEARRLAATYLQSYPRGRFRAQAQRVIDASR